MAADAFTLVKMGVEGDIQVAYGTVSTVSNNDTTDFTKFTKNIIDVSAKPSTAVAVGYTVSSGVVTWLISGGTPNLNVRVAFQ